MYSDFQCPYCGRFVRETLPALHEQYIRPGKVLLAFREFPLPNHAFAEKAAEAAACAGRQGRFWEVHDDLFANQQALDVPSVMGRVRRFGLNARAFETCLAGELAGAVRADKVGGELLGVSGTPTFLIGMLLDGGHVRVTERFSGALPLAEFQRTLDRVLASAAPVPKPVGN